MTPGTVTAVAFLISELAVQGMSIAAMLKEAKGTGKIPPEQWAAIMDEVKAANELWESQ